LCWLREERRDADNFNPIPKEISKLGGNKMFDKKWVNILIMMFILFNVMVVAAHAAGNTSLLDTVKQYSQDGGKAMVADVDNVVFNGVFLFRSIVTIVGVGLFVWAGVAFGTAHGDPNKILLAKKIMGGFIVCLICIFEAEKIVGVLMGILGFQIPTQ
jgi:hypothetical protein